MRKLIIGSIILATALMVALVNEPPPAAQNYPWPWDTFKQVSTLMSDSLSTAVIDSGNVNAGGLSVTDISNGGNGFTTKVSVRDSVAAWIARSDSSLFPDGKLSIAEIQQLSVRLGELILKAALADSLATNYGIQESGVAWIDSSHVKDASISGADLVNPLRYTGSGYVTGLWQADSLKVSNTGTNNSYLQSWWKNGVKKAYIDTVGYLSVNRIGLNNASPVYAIDLGANDIYMGVKVISTNNNQELTISPYDLTISSRVIGMTGSNMVTISGVPLILTGNVGSGTTAPVASSLTLGSSATQKDLVVTREQTPAASDSSFKVTIASGNPQTIYNASDGDTYTQTINASDQAVFSGAAGGYTFDAPIKTTAIYNKFALNATLPDTTGFVGGETWYSAIGDTTYIYKSDHTIDSVLDFIARTTDLADSTNFVANALAKGDVAGLTDDLALRMLMAAFDDSLFSRKGKEWLAPLPVTCDTTASAQDSTTVKVLTDINGLYGRKQLLYVYGNASAAQDTTVWGATFNPQDNDPDSLIVWLYTTDEVNTSASIEIYNSAGTSVYSSGVLTCAAASTWTYKGVAFGTFADLNEHCIVYRVRVLNAADAVTIGQTYFKRN